MSGPVFETYADDATSVVNRFSKFTGDSIVGLAVAANEECGIATEVDAVGGVTVVHSGEAYVTAGQALVAGDRVTPDGTGKAVISATGMTTVRVGAPLNSLAQVVVHGRGVAAGGGGGEANTASNVGTAGVGVWKQKVGVNLEFKKINAGSAKVTITDDVANNEVDVDVVTGSSGTTVCVGDDARLSDSRTPLAHAASHKSGGSDSIRLDEFAATIDNTLLNATTLAHGLLPKLGGGTTNFLRADGAWAAPGGGGSPGGANTHIQFNNAGAFGGSANFIWDDINGNAAINGGFDFTAIAALAAGANSTRVHARNMANRILLALRGATENAFCLQPALWGRAVSWTRPGSGTTINVFGLPALTSVGTASHPAIANTNDLTRMLRTQWASAAGAGSSAGARIAVNLCNLTSGFFFACRFGFGTAVAQQRSIVGLLGSTGAIANVNPSTLLNLIGVGYDSAQTNLRIMHNDGAGAATVIDLGVNFPVNTTEVYDVAFYCVPGGATVGYYVRRLSTGGEASGTLSTNLPLAAQLLTQHLNVNNGTTASAAQIVSAMTYLERQQ